MRAYPQIWQDEPTLGREHTELFAALCGRHPRLAAFGGWPELIATIRSGLPQDPATDELLWPVLQVSSQDRNEYWQAVILKCFWPSLWRLYERSRRWSQSAGDLWQDTLLAFLQVVRERDPNHHQQGVAQKILRWTRDRLRQSYRRHWRSARRQFSETDTGRVLDPSRIDEGFARIDMGDALKAEGRRLRGLRDEGLLSEADYRLLFCTRLLGEPLRSYAAKAGLSYEAARKRRQRVERLLGGTHGIEDFCFDHPWTGID
jgi:hypothetical protein